MFIFPFFVSPCLRNAYGTFSVSFLPILDTFSKPWLILIKIKIKVALLALASQLDRRMFVYNVIQGIECLLYLFI